MMKILKRKGVVIMAYKSMRDCYIYQQMENIIQEGIAGASSKGRLLTNNELDDPSLKNLFPIQYLNTDLVIPFYFDHHRISPNAKLNLDLFKSQFSANIKQFVTNFNQFDAKNTDLVLTLYQYQEQYQAVLK